MFSVESINIKYTTLDSNILKFVQIFTLGELIK